MTMLLFCVTIWMFAMAMQNSLTDWNSILFWFKIKISIQQFLPQSWLFFVLQYLGAYNRIAVNKRRALGIIPSLSMVLIWTNDWHYLFWNHPLTTSDIISNATAASAIGAGQWFSIFFQLAYFAAATYLLLQSVRRKNHHVTESSILLLTCSLLPWLIDTSLTAGISGQWASYLSPFISFTCFILFIMALFRYRLLNIIPIAFEALIEEMSDAMLVLDSGQTILHLNPSAEQILGISSQAAIGKPAGSILAGYPVLVPYCYQDITVSSSLLTLTTAQGDLFFEVMVTPIHNTWHNTIGRIIILHNVSSRIKAEATTRQSQALLHRSEETYRELIENINEVIFTLDSNLVLNYISPVIERYTGYQSNEIVGQRLDQLVHPDDLAGLHYSLEQALAGENTACEFRLIDKNGQEHFTRAQYHRRMQEGKTASLQGMLTDFTEYRRTQEALERQTLQLTMLNHIGEQIAAVMELDSILDNATRLIRSNFGYYHVALFLPDYAQNCLVMRSAAGAFASIFPANHRLKLGQGIVGWVAENHNIMLANDVRANPSYVNFFPDKIVTLSELAVPVMLYDELVGVLDIQSPIINGFNENDVRVLKTVADQIAVAIGNARLYDQLKLQLKESEKKENLLRIQRDLLVDLGSYTSLNEMLEEAAQVLAREMHVPLVEIFLLSPSGSSLVEAAALGTSQQIGQEITLDMGVVGWVVSHCQPALIPDVMQVPYYLAISAETRSEICAPLQVGDRLIGVINLESPQIAAFTQDDLRLLTSLSDNLTVLIERARLFNEVERARSELEDRAKALEAANERLRELDRLKSQFLANMSHELRTPLNSIIGFSEVIYDEVPGPINADQREYIRYIYESGKHLLELINDLLDFSKIEAGRMKLERTTFQVEGLLMEVRSIISQQIEKKDQQLTFDIEEDLPPITADRLRMRQVFFNLLSNANKFSPPGGKIYVNCRRDANGLIHFAVQDDGIGIRDENQDLIFEEFRQVDGSLTREVAGTGLGLAISKRIIELHNGFIWVESKYGHGSTFHISLPIDETPDMI